MGLKHRDIRDIPSLISTNKFKMAKTAARSKFLKTDINFFYFCPSLFDFFTFCDPDT